MNNATMVNVAPIQYQVRESWEVDEGYCSLYPKIPGPGTYSVTYPNECYP